MSRRRDRIAAMRTPRPAVTPPQPQPQPQPQPLTLPLLPATTQTGATVLSAVRVGTSDHPIEYMVIVDCHAGTPVHQYTTLRVYCWPDRATFNAGEYNLTWMQAQHSLAEHAGLIPHRDIEVAVIAREPHHKDLVHIFVNGAPAESNRGTTVRTEVFYLDPDDEETHELRDGLQRAASLSPAAHVRVTQDLNEFADEHGIEVGDE